MNQFGITNNRDQKTAEKGLQILRENYFEPKIIYLLGQFKMFYATEIMTYSAVNKEEATFLI